MPFSIAGVAALPAIGGAVSVASGINSLVNSGGPGGGPGPGTPAGAGGGSPFLYQPTGQPQQDVNLQNIINSQYGTATTVPQNALASQIPTAFRLANNPYATPYIAAGQQAGAAAGTLAGQEQGAAGTLFGGGNQVFQTAMDPQKALYNRMLGQLTDQSTAVNAMYGLGSSPVGAGLTEKEIGNFNIDWQNQQLQRQLQGLQGAGRAFAGGADLGQAGVSNTLQAGALPFNTYGNVFGSEFNALGLIPEAVRASFGPQQVAAGNIQSYLGLGQNAANAALNQQAQRFQQSQTGLNTLGDALGGLSQLYGPNTGSNWNTNVPNMFPAAASSAGVDPQTFMFGGDTGAGFGTFPSE